MKLQLKLEINYRSLKDFSVGAEFSKNELLKYSKEIKTPEDWTLQEVINTVRHNWKEDFCHLSWYLKTRFTRIKYIVQSVKIHKNFMYILMVASSPIFVGLSIANTLPDKELTTNINTVTEVKKLAEKPHKKLKKAVKKETAKMKEVRKEHKELMKELGLEVQPLKKVIKKESKNVSLPKYNLPENMEGKFVPNNIAKDIFFTQAEFEVLLKLVYKKFCKYEDEFRINPYVEVARFTYESFTRTTKNGVNGWNMSNLGYASGNHSGIKCFNPKNQAFVIKYDDGIDAIDAKGNSRFILFQRNDIFDFDNWILYQVSVVLANKDYYNPDHRNYKDVASYAYEFKRYATKPEYCKTLVSRARMVEKIIKQ